MQITISEALRLKNEISKHVNAIKYKSHSAPMGITKENDNIVNDEGEMRFKDVIESLRAMLCYSEEINNAVADFNKQNGVDAIVRKMQNEKLICELYQGRLQHTKPLKKTKFENVGNNRIAISTSTIPDISSKEMKELISSKKTIIREHQTKIEKLNSNVITLTFSYEDVEALILE